MDPCLAQGERIVALGRLGQETTSPIFARVTAVRNESIFPKSAKNGKPNPSQSPSTGKFRPPQQRRRSGIEKLKPLQLPSTEKLGPPQQKRRGGIEKFKPSQKSSAGKLGPPQQRRGSGTKELKLHHDSWPQRPGTKRQRPHTRAGSGTRKRGRGSAAIWTEMNA